MLSLMRRVGESVLIGDDIKVVVTQITDNQVKIGIEAPIDINIVRSEIPKIYPVPHRKRKWDKEEIKEVLRKAFMDDLDMVSLMDRFE